MLKLLADLCKAQHISQADYFFAKLIADQQKSQNYTNIQQNLAILLAALCQHSLSKGNTCLFLDRDLESSKL